VRRPLLPLAPAARDDLKRLLDAADSAAKA